MRLDAGLLKPTQPTHAQRQSRRLEPAASLHSSRRSEVEAHLHLCQVGIGVFDLEAAVLAAQRDMVGEAVLHADAVGRIGAAVIGVAGHARNRGVEIPALEAGLGVGGELSVIGSVPTAVR